MPKAKPVCMVCTGPVRYGALFCSRECEAFHDNGHWDSDKELQAKGFKRDGETPNLYHKDGVAVSIEHVRAVGMDKAILHHEIAVQAKA